MTLKRNPLLFQTTIMVVMCAGILGCSPKPDPKASTSAQPKTRGEILLGVWKGEHKEPEDKGKGSNYLAQRLGGYSLMLQDNGEFLADWRGLVREGQWKLEGDTVKLDIKRVFGKDEKQATDENKASGRPTNDLSLYNSDLGLVVGSDNETLTLTSKEKGSETVVFRKDTD